MRAIMIWVISCVILGLTGYVKGYKDANSKAELAIAKQAAEAKTKQDTLQTEADTNAKQAQADRLAITTRLNTALERLRQRPDRLPESARANCKGSSGAELSREDGQAFTRFASDCQLESSALSQCYTHVDLITKTINGK